jgi:uncharacterized protein (DUF58 family)
VVSIGTGFAALNTGNNLLYLVLSLMLAFLVLSGVMSEWALRGIHVRRFPPRELHARTDGSVAIEIRNDQRWLPSYAIVIEDRVIDPPAPTAARRTPERAAGRAFALRVGAGGRVTRSYRLRPARRGTLRFTQFRVSTRFPFGLFLKSKTLDAPGEVLVYPRLERVPARPAPAATALGDDARASGAGPGSEVAGLRDFAPGDPLRRVHWRASLRRSQLVVRQPEDERSLVWEVRLRTAGAAGAEAFEESVSRAASEIVAGLDAGLCVGLHTDAERFAPEAGARQRARLLSFLALVEPRGAGAREAA